MGFFQGALNGVIDIVLLLFILVSLVVVHEFGHFIVARRAKVRVHEFGIGFPPRARVLGRDSETVYTLNWLPIGGFVRLEGEEGESADPKAFVNARLRTRLLILAAGVVMNFFVAWIIFGAIAAVADPIADARIGQVVAGSPAEAAGLKGGNVLTVNDKGEPLTYDDAGDLITAIDGRAFPVFDSVELVDTTPQGLYLREHAGQQVVVSIQHADGSIAQVPVTLRAATDPPQPALGVFFSAFPRHDIQRGAVDGLTTGFRRTIDASGLILRGLRDLVTDIAHPQVSGPIGVVGAVGSVRSDLPPTYLFWLIGVISANLAVVNAVPFPPMDGGRFAVSIIQALTGNRISPRVERGISMTGLALLLGLIVWISFFDIGLLDRGT
ncbi:MAG: M50 family metallopeptidase [Candidatus Limnocylindrales bacterium]